MNFYPISSLSDEELAEIPIHSFRSKFLQKKYVELKDVREQILIQNWLNQNRKKVLQIQNEVKEDFFSEEVFNTTPITEEMLERALQKNRKELYPLLLVRIISILEDITEEFIQEDPWEEEELKEIRSLVMSSQERGANLFDYLLLSKNLTLYSYIRNKQDFGDVLEILAQARELRNKILHPHREKIHPLSMEEILEVWRSAVRFLLFTNAVAKPSILNDLRQKLSEQSER